jgi:hypothetical protein
MGLRKNVVETLVSTPIKWINFTFANRMISPIGYYYIASMVSNEQIKCEVDAKLQHTAMYNFNKNTITASDGSYGETYFDEKSLLVHECTHAILDIFYKGRDMNGGASAGITVLEDETIAYLAQAMYVVAANGATPNDSSLPDYHASDVVEDNLKAIMKKGWTGCDTLHFTTADVTALQTSIKKNALYKSSYSSIAVHNG